MKIFYSEHRFLAGEWLLRYGSEPQALAPPLVAGCGGAVLYLLSPATDPALEEAEDACSSDARTTDSHFHLECGDVGPERRE